jgi:hypothetical protein
MHLKVWGKGFARNDGSLWSRQLDIDPIRRR